LTIGKAGLAEAASVAKVKEPAMKKEKPFEEDLQ